ncbi:MAG: ABC transporter permease subunit [Dialister invisus]
MRAATVCAFFPDCGRPWKYPLSVIGSVIFGLFTGLFMTLQNRAAKLISRFYLEFIRIMPQLVLLFIAYFGITRAFGISLSGFAASVIVFILWEQRKWATLSEARSSLSLRASMKARKP